MKTLLFASVLLIAASASLVVPKPSQFLMGRTHLEGNTKWDMPQNWEDTLIRPRNMNKTRRLTIKLKRHNLDWLESKFWAVSDPQNADYGNYLSLAEIREKIAPSAEEVTEVEEWLEEHGITNHRLLKSGDIIFATATLAQIEKLAEVEFTIHKNAETGKFIAGSLGPYSVPTHIAKRVEIISGICGLPIAMRGPIRGYDEYSSSPITPDVIHARYNVTLPESIAANMSQAVAEFQGQYYSPEDLKDFANKFEPSMNTTIDAVIGTNQPNSPGLEASLDVQYIMGGAPNVLTKFYSIASFNFWADLNEWQGWLNDEDHIPLVISISYGSQGDYPSNEYQFSADVEYMKFGVRGSSILYASGDDGSACQDCTFYPSYPATSPYVTSVGATRFIEGNSGAEAAVSNFLSGGGFSYTYALQSYQETAVQNYFESGVEMPAASSYNATGRATPDVSALGAEEFQVYDGGSITPVGGTSASSPTFSAVISLLNNIQLSNGQPSLGFLNNWLYQSADVDGFFFDVTVGNNIIEGCCNRADGEVGSIGGFNTAVGWDPVSGLGTPNFAVMSQNLPSSNK